MRFLSRLSTQTVTLSTAPPCAPARDTVAKHTDVVIPMRNAGFGHALTCGPVSQAPRLFLKPVPRLGGGDGARARGRIWSAPFCSERWLRVVPLPSKCRLKLVAMERMMIQTAGLTRACMYTRNPSPVSQLVLQRSQTHTHTHTSTHTRTHTHTSIHTSTCVRFGCRRG